MLVKCFQCGIEFDKKPYELKRSKRHFCSNKCCQLSKKPQGACKTCYNPIKKRYKYCDTCKPKQTIKKYYCVKCNKLLANSYKELEQIKGVRTTCKECNITYTNWSNITLNEFKKNKTLSNYHGRLRALSRQSYKNNNKPNFCYNCKYDKHIQICHIKSVSDFDDNATIDIVNHPDNLIGLCPNCHWEFDNGLLKIPDLGAAPSSSRI